MSSDLNVYFSDSWTLVQEERARVFEHAWCDVRCRASTSTSRPSEKWIVVNTPLEESNDHFAHRGGTYTSVTGGSVDGLVRE